VTYRPLGHKNVRRNNYIDISALEIWNQSLLEKLVDLGQVRDNRTVALPVQTPESIHSPLFNCIGATNPLDFVDLWLAILDEHFDAPVWMLMLVVEGLRSFPSVAYRRMQEINQARSTKKLNFNKTLAEAIHREADALYNDGRRQLALGEIDGALFSLSSAAAEFKFAIESGALSINSTRIATGKYAAAVAQIGRWLPVPGKTLRKALECWEQSSESGNDGFEAKEYRLELLLQMYDETNDIDYLDICNRYKRDNPQEESELKVVYIETTLRKAVASSYPMREHLLKLARHMLEKPRQIEPNSETRLTCLEILLRDLEDNILDLPPTALAIPHGLVREIVLRPNEYRIDLIRRMAVALELLSDRLRSNSPLNMSINLLRNLVDTPGYNGTNNLRDAYFHAAVRLNENIPNNRHYKMEAAVALLNSTQVISRQNDLRARLKELRQANPQWVLPEIVTAKFLENNPDTIESASSHWQRAAELALNSSHLRRTRLGGKNVFEIADARGFVSDLLVFKPTTRESAQEERTNLSRLSGQISSNSDLRSRFTTPRSLAIISNPNQGDSHQDVIHVIQRQRGRTFVQMDILEAKSHLFEAIALLAEYQKCSFIDEISQTGWQPIKNSLKTWESSFTNRSQAEELRTLFASCHPTDVPLLKKRDSHAENWLATPDARVAAIDLESKDFVRFGCDLAQLTEDHQIFEPSDSGFQERIELLDHYLDCLEMDIDRKRAVEAYLWFVLIRAIFIATKGNIGRSESLYARQLCEMVSRQTQEHHELADATLALISNRSYSIEFTPLNSRRRITLSKAIAKLLRHGSSGASIPMTDDGYVEKVVLADYLNIDVLTLETVALHPAESRFEVSEGLIRARYGHSLELNIERSPSKISQSLFHGTSWQSLPAILARGLQPMTRSHVHLSSNPQDAIETGSRHGRPVLLSVSVEAIDEVVQAADGIWLSNGISPERIQIEQYADELNILGK
jgi:RNA:NAD 2'-phosphotransferase (TPT1/KptA family)